MGFDGIKALAGAALYLPFVILPTASVMLGHYGHDSPVAARILVGLVSILAGRLIWEGVRGPESMPSGMPQRWLGVTPWALIAAAVVFYLAWFSNLPNALAGSFDGAIFVAGSGTVELTNVASRVVSSLLSALGAYMLRYGFTTHKSREQRRQERLRKRQERRQETQSYMDESDFIE